MVFPLRSAPSVGKSEAAGKEKSGGRQDAKPDKPDGRRRRKADKAPAAPAPSRETRSNAREKARAGAAKADPLFDDSDDDKMAGGEGIGDNMGEAEERRGRDGGPGERPASPPPPLSSPEGGRKDHFLGAIRRIRFLSVYGGI